MGKRACDLIRDYLMNDCTDYIDFIFVGNRGADFSAKNDKKYLGSVANEIVRNTNLNVMFMHA